MSFPIPKCAGIAAVLLALGHVGLRAAQLDKDFLVTPFTVEDGLPQNTVIDIEQTKDGYLWLGTYAGLARFDGAQFTTFDGFNTPGLNGSGIFMLSRDLSGALWIVGDDWRLTRMKDGQFERYSGRFGLPDVSVSIEGEGPDGQLAFGHLSTNEEFILSNGRFAARPVITNLPAGYADRLVVDEHGYVWWREGANWIHSRNKDLQTILPSSNGTNAIRVTRPRRAGGIWIVTARGLYAWQDGKTISDRPAPMPIESCPSMLEDSAGNIWVGTWLQGLWRIDPEGNYHHYEGCFGKSFTAVRALHEDREGNIWIGTEGNGLFRVRKKFCDVIDAAKGLSGEAVFSVAADTNDQVWVIAQGWVDCINAKRSNNITKFPSVGLTWDLYCNREGTVYVGSYAGTIWSPENGTLKRLGETSPTAAITSLFQESGETLWIGTGEGLWTMAGGKVTPSDSPLPRDAVKTMASDEAGDLFVGMSAHGLWQRTKEKWTAVAKEDLTDVRALLPTTNGLWIGTQKQGLWRMKGSQLFSCQLTAVNLPRQISCLALDKIGNIWCGSEQGIYRISARDLDRLADGAIEDAPVAHYGKPDGLPTSECTSGRQQTVCETSDGRLWFATGEGVAVIDPAAIPTNTLVPPVMVESALVTHSGNGNRPERTTQFQAVPFTVPPGNSRVEIHYTALSLTAPERVQFRFRLDGLDQDWTEAGTRRVAYYQGLKPGAYRFHVLACNNDGCWNLKGATLAFVVQPWFWQTSWFAALAVAVVGGLLWLAYRIRLARLAEVTNLRLRIARDLHDEIGANLGSIGLNVQLLMSDSAIGEQQRKDLAGINQITSQTAQAARDIVWMTNPDFDNISGMVRRMRELAAVMLAGRKWNLDEPADGDSTPLPLNLRRNIFFAFKECLHNIVKHSGAKEVKIVLRADKYAIELKVRDNGRGFDPAATGSGTGLRNLRRRAAEMGGAMSVTTGPGKGAEIFLRMPIRSARRFWQWLAPPEKS